MNGWQIFRDQPVTPLNKDFPFVRLSTIDFSNCHNVLKYIFSITRHTGKIADSSKYRSIFFFVGQRKKYNGMRDRENQIRQRSKSLSLYVIPLVKENRSSSNPSQDFSKLVDVGWMLQL